jgi:hypothetical protein
VRGQLFDDVPITKTNEKELPAAYTDRGGFKGVLWDKEHGMAYAWTDDTPGAYLYGMPLASLTEPVDTFDPDALTVSSSSASFRLNNDISVQTGVYVPTTDEVFLYGSNKLYRFADLTNLDAVDSSFTFPSLLLPQSSVTVDGVSYAAQWLSPRGGAAPQLYATDLSKYSEGYLNSTTSYDILNVEMAFADVDPAGAYVTLGYRSGWFEIRSATPSPDGSLPLEARFKIVGQDDITKPVRVQAAAFVTTDTDNFIYMCAEYDDQIYLLRANTDDTSALDGKEFRAWDDSFINATDPNNGPSNTNDESLFMSMLVGDETNVQCDGIVVDSYSGVGYVAQHDTYFVGYMVKFDAVNMIIRSDPILVSTRENSAFIGITLERGSSEHVIYGVTQSSVVSFVDYPSACPADCNGDRGECVASVCVCNVEWMGDACEEAACVQGCNEDDINYGPHGECRQGKCFCTKDWEGELCEQQRCPYDCNGFGECDTSTFTCNCDENHAGDDCSAVHTPLPPSTSTRLTFSLPLRLARI